MENIVTRAIFKKIHRVDCAQKAVLDDSRKAYFL